MSLIAELKRRNVFKVGAAYLALAWVMIQLTGTAAPAFGMPEWTLKLVMWIGLLGFPFVVMFAWIFELTPEGLKREHEVDRSQSITPHTGRKLDYLIVGLLVAAIAMFAIDRFAPRGAPANENSRAEARPTTSSQLDAGVDGEVGRASARQESSPTSTNTPDPNSIAVLPFVNMSSDKEQEFFSDGISEELLNLLAKIPELQVTSRSSAFAFKGKEIDLPVVAAKLNVANILEGSVRKSGNRVRITAQLVDARRDKHLWSETYDRELTDIFATQDEIASAVVAQLKITLLGEAPKAKVTNPEAYALFLQGRQLRRQSTAASLEQAVALQQKALALDPGYAEAWDELSRTYSNQATANLRPYREAYELARAAVDKALALDPKLARAHDSLGGLAATHDLDMATAAQHYRQAIMLEPGNLAILGNAASTVLQGLGRLDQAITVMEFASERDPTNGIRLGNLAILYMSASRFDDAVARYRLLLALAPDFLLAHSGLGQALLLRGEPQDALAELQKEADAGSRLVGLAEAWHTLGDRAQSDAALAELEKDYAQQLPFLIAEAYAWRGQADEAFAWLEKAVIEHDALLLNITTDPFLASLHQDPRWLPFLHKIHLAPEQLAAIEFEVKLPQ